MPVYTVVTEMAHLDQAQKQELAVGITRIHAEQSPTLGEPIHVVFFAYPKGAGWSSAEPSSPIMVTSRFSAHGLEHLRERLTPRITGLVCEVLGVPARDVLVDLDIDPGGPDDCDPPEPQFA